jgi:hypothetical protein
MRMMELYVPDMLTRFLVSECIILTQECAQLFLPDGAGPLGDSSGKPSNISITVKVRSTAGAVTPLRPAVRQTAEKPRAEENPNQPILFPHTPVDRQQSVSQKNEREEKSQDQSLVHQTPQKLQTEPMAKHGEPLQEKNQGQQAESTLATFGLDHNWSVPEQPKQERPLEASRAPSPDHSSAQERDKESSRLAQRQQNPPLLDGYTEQQFLPAGDAMNGTDHSVHPDTRDRDLRPYLAPPAIVPLDQQIPVAHASLIIHNQPTTNGPLDQYQPTPRAPPEQLQSTPRIHVDQLQVTVNAHLEQYPSSGQGTSDQHNSELSGRKAQPQSQHAQHQRALTLEQQREIQLQLQTQLRLQREEQDLYAGISRHRDSVDSFNRLHLSANISSQEERPQHAVAHGQPLNSLSRSKQLDLFRALETQGDDIHQDPLHLMSHEQRKEANQYVQESKLFQQELKLYSQGFGQQADESHIRRQRQQDEELVHSIIQEQRYDSWLSSRDFTSPTDKSSTVALMLQQARCPYP